jgi:hypothetical protein
MLAAIAKLRLATPPHAAQTRATPTIATRTGVKVNPPPTLRETRNNQPSLQSRQRHPLRLLLRRLRRNL